MAAADTLTERMDALAEALRAAGVAPDRVAAILTSAATATMNALVLDAVLENNAAPAPPQAADEQRAEPLKAAA
jgi:coenzyme F420-reducing hydrogenase delta subunit